MNHGEFDGIGLAVGGEGVIAVKLYVLPLVYTQLVFVYAAITQYLNWPAVSHFSRVNTIPPKRSPLPK